MSKYSTDDVYVDPASGVLINRLGITSEAQLASIEADFVAARAFELSQNPISPPFSTNSLKIIHKRLFTDLYEWAGHFRTVDLSKGSSRFANINHIESCLDRVFSRLEQENFLHGLDKHNFSQRAAFYMGELNAVHPFREGNGRTQREFINQLAYGCGYNIHWKNMKSADIFNATIYSFKGNYVPLENLIFTNLL